MRLRRGQKRMVVISIILVLVLLVVGYMRFFNGTFIYLSTGMKNTQLAKVGDQITYTFEANLLMSDAKEQYESVFDSSVWTQEIDGISFEEYVMDQIRAKLMRIRAMNALAEERGVALSRESRDAVAHSADAYLAGLTEAQVEALGITRDALMEMFTDFAVAQQLYEDMTSVMDIEISADDARVINIQYISTDSATDIQQAKAELDSGNSFYTVVNKYHMGEEYECELKRGEMQETFEEAAFDLKSGETSEIIEIDGMYYLIKCTSDNDKVKTEVNQTILLEEKQLALFNETFEAYEAKLFIEWNSKQWDTMSVSSSEIYAVNFEEIFNEYFK